MSNLPAAEQKGKHNFPLPVSFSSSVAWYKKVIKKISTWEPLGVNRTDFAIFK